MMTIKRGICITIAMVIILTALSAFIPVKQAMAASVEIEVQPGPDAKDTTNILLRPDSGSRKVNIRLVDYEYDDSEQFDGLYLELVQPDGSIAKGMTVSNKLRMDKQGNTYSYELEMTSRNMTGLYSINVYPFKGNMHLTDGSGNDISAFYYAAEGGSVLSMPADGGASSFTPLTKFSTSNSISGEIYMAQGGNVLYTVELAALPSGISSMNIKMIDPLTGEYFAKKDRLNANSTVRETYTIGSATDGAKLQFKVLAVSYGDNGEQVCQLHTLSEQLTGNNRQQVTIDAAGPVIGDIKISNPSFYIKEQAGFMYSQIPGDPATYVEVSKITDSGAGVDLDDSQSKSYVRFVNLASANHTVGASSGSSHTRLVNSDASAQLYKGASNAAMLSVDILPGGRHSSLVDSQWRMQVVAVDVLGNETVKEYGRIIVYNKYTEVNEVRIEQHNILDMYVGQQLSLQQLEDRGITAVINADASFPDAWTWTITASANNIVDYDAATGILTAKKAGEGRITAIALSRYDGDNARGSDYLSIRVAAEPTVTSLVLDHTSIELKPGDEQQLKATIDPAIAKVKWESKDESVATVDDSGNVKAIADGATAVVASSGEWAVACTVVVKSDPVATDISINKEQLRLGTGQSEQLFAATTPRGLPIIWSSSNSNIAIVDQEGNVTALKEGTTDVIATSGSKSASCSLTVYLKAEPNTWVKNSSGQWLYFDEQALVTYGWKKINGVWYLFDGQTGIMKTGWAKDSNTWYYLTASGAMKIGWLQDGYNADGTARWYYLQGSGAMMSGGWLKIANSSGEFKWYFFLGSGAMHTGWLKLYNSATAYWYYMKQSGAMVTGLYTIDGRVSRFAESGRWLGYE